MARETSVEAFYGAKAATERGLAAASLEDVLLAYDVNQEELERLPYQWDTTPERARALGNRSAIKDRLLALGVSDVDAYRRTMRRIAAA